MQSKGGIMKTLNVFLSLILLVTSLWGQDVIFSDDFESGQLGAGWFTFWDEEENLSVQPMGDVPQPLPEGGDYLGYLQDADGTYTGAALALNGDLTAQNYTVEAHVYCYTNPAGPSAYTGVAAYADPLGNYYVKLVADFDGDNRLRLYNNDFDMGTFSYSFAHDIDATGLYDGDGWHTLGLEIATLEDGSVNYTAYFDGLYVGGPFNDDTDYHTQAGAWGVFSFQQDEDGLAGYFDNVTVSVPPGEEEILFADDFETGFPADEWMPFWEDEELIDAVNMTSAPAILGNGGEYVGFLQDADGTYTGAAMSISGSISDQNYSVVADVYCYADAVGVSAYTGIAAYADPDSNYYVKLVADFDADNRLRLYNNDFSMETFEYTFHHAIDATGLYDGDGWHNMQLDVETLDDGTVAYTVYFDGNMIGGPFIDDAEGHTTSGYYGVFSFQQDEDGLAGYFDNVEIISQGVPEILYGDVNDDTAIDILDIVMMVGIIMGTIEPTDYALLAGDMNGDGALDILDIVSVVTWILGDNLNRGNAIGSASLTQFNDQVLINTDGSIAGLQLDFNGELQITDLDVTGWILRQNKGGAILYNLGAGSPPTEMRLTISGSGIISSALVADWHGNGINAIRLVQPTEMTLDAYPNPFNPQTTLRYQLRTAGAVKIAVYDLSGRLVSELYNGQQTIGNHQILWQPQGIASGVYLVQLVTANESAVTKINFLK